MLTPASAGSAIYQHWSLLLLLFRLFGTAVFPVWAAIQELILTPENNIVIDPDKRGKYRLVALYTVLKDGLISLLAPFLQNNHLVALLLDLFPLPSWCSQGFHHWKTLQGCIVLSLHSKLDVILLMLQRSALLHTCIYKEHLCKSLISKCSIKERQEKACFGHFLGML